MEEILTGKEKEARIGYSGLYDPLIEAVRIGLPVWTP
jgi:hypothetical protein